MENTIITKEEILDVIYNDVADIEATIALQKEVRELTEDINFDIDLILQYYSLGEFLAICKKYNVEIPFHGEIDNMRLVYKLAEDYIFERLNTRLLLENLNKKLDYLIELNNQNNLMGDNKL